MQKKLDVKYYLLLFIESFNIWQMGIVFYASKTLTINNLVHTPVTLHNSMLIIVLGYLLGVMIIYLLPKKTILIGRIAMIISLICSIILFFPITPDFFSICFYILTFHCVLFISINASLIINYYSVKTVLIDFIMASIFVGLLIAICQNDIIPLSFYTFNALSVVLLTLIIFALFKLPLQHEIMFIKKDDKSKKPSKKLMIGLVITTIVSNLITLFTASISSHIANGVSISYLGCFISGIVFAILVKKKKVYPIKLLTYYFSITALGFLIYLLANNELKYISLFFQGFGYLIILAIPYLLVNLFDLYPSKRIAPIYICLALFSVIIDSILLELFRESPATLYVIYAFISVLGIILYLIVEKDCELNYLSKRIDLNKLSKREQEVANLLIKGYNAKEIATTLFISEYTAKDHIKNIYKKYNVNSRIKLLKIISDE